MKLVDVHCHLDGERFENDLDKVIGRAEDAGVKYILASGAGPKSNRKVSDLTKKYPCVKASFGIYPIDALFPKFPNVQDDDLRPIESFDYRKEMDWIEAQKEVCVAIGEVGMDFKVVKDLIDFEEIKKEQMKIFEEIIIFAKKLDKPIVIHSRGAELECIELLAKHKMPKVLMHCFGGKKSLIKLGVENGFYFSVPAVITRLQHFETLVGIVPLEQLLTETDAPYLAPVAGERSEPANVAITVEHIARIKNLPKEEVAKQIFENSCKLFGWE